MARLQVPRPMNSLGIPFGSRGISWAFPPGPSVLGIAFRSQLTAPADAYARACSYRFPPSHSRAGADQRQVLSSLKAPDFTLPDMSGKTHSLSDFRGKKVLLVTWASW